MGGKKKRFKFTLNSQGQRVGFCRQCHPTKEDDKPWYHLDPLRALYIRIPSKGFKRIGWFFENCSHVEIDAEVVEKGWNNTDG